MIPAEAVEAAAKVFAVGMWGRYDPEDVPRISNAVREMLEAAAPHMLADILEDAAKTAETDELTTAAEVIYDLRRHAKDLRPTHGNH